MTPPAPRSHAGSYRDLTTISLRSKTTASHGSKVLENAEVRTSPRDVQAHCVPVGYSRETSQSQRLHRFGTETSLWACTLSGGHRLRITPAFNRVNTHGLPGDVRSARPIRSPVRTPEKRTAAGRLE